MVLNPVDGIERRFTEVVFDGGGQLPDVGELERLRLVGGVVVPQVLRQRRERPGVRGGRNIRSPEAGVNTLGMPA